MLLCRELFLVTLISAISVVFADILIQPELTSYGRRYEPYNVQPVSWQFPMKLEYPCLVPITEKSNSQESSDQYVAAAQPQQLKEIPTVYPHTVKPNFYQYAYKDVPNEFVTTRPWQHTEIQTGYPHTVNPNVHRWKLIPPYEDVPDNYILLPNDFTTARRGGSYTKLGGHGYTRPTVIIKYPKSLAHRRNKRSTETTSNKFDKPAITTHADDVAAKSALIDDRPPPSISSLLPKNQLATNDKHVTSRQIRSDHAATRPGLFGLNPEKMHGYHQAESPNEIQQPFQSLSVSPNTPKQSDQQLASIIEPVAVEQAPPTLSAIPQEKQLQALYQDQRNAYKESDSKLLQENTYIEGTKSPRQAPITIKSPIPMTDQSATISFTNPIPILKHIQDQYSHILPRIKNLKDTPQDKMIDESPIASRLLSPLISLSDYEKKTHIDGTEYFTNDRLNYNEENIKNNLDNSDDNSESGEFILPTFSPWLKKLLFWDKNKYSQDFDSYSDYSTDNSNSDDNSNSVELSSPTQKCSFYRLCFPLNDNRANCVTYKICNILHNVNTIYVLKTND